MIWKILIENMLVTSLILDYGIEKKNTHNSKEIDLKSFIIKFELKSILVGNILLVNPKLIYLILLALILQLSQKIW